MSFAIQGLEYAPRQNHDIDLEYLKVKSLREGE